MSRLAAARTAVAVTPCSTTRTRFSRGTYSTSEIWPSPSASIWASMASMSESSKSSPRDRKHLTRSGAPRNPFWSTSAKGAASRGARGRDECQHAGVCDEGADRVSLSRGRRPSWEKTFLISCSSSLFGSSAIASFVCCSAISPSAFSIRFALQAAFAVDQRSGY